MNITKTKDNGTLTIALEGRLDTMTAPQLEEEIRDSIEGTELLVFDLEKLEYMSSAGLRVMLSAQKQMAESGAMKETHVNEIIMEIFEVTGFVDILTIE